MRRLTWSPQSERDLIDIAEYYEQIDPVLAEDMIERIEAAPEPLLDFPFLGAVAVGGARKWSTPKLPFLLFYDVTDDEVEIVAVRHVRSNWQR